MVRVMEDGTLTWRTSVYELAPVVDAGKVALGDLDRVEEGTRLCWRALPAREVNATVPKERTPVPGVAGFTLEPDWLREDPRAWVMLRGSLLPRQVCGTTCQVRTLGDLLTWADGTARAMSFGPVAAWVLEGPIVQVWCTIPGRPGARACQEQVA